MGRKTKAEVLLFRKLREAIKELNPDICAEAEELAIQELAKDRSRLSPEKANQETVRNLRPSTSFYKTDSVFSFQSPF